MRRVIADGDRAKSYGTSDHIFNLETRGPERIDQKSIHRPAPEVLDLVRELGLSDHVGVAPTGRRPAIWSEGLHPLPTPH